MDQSSQQLLMGTLAYILVLGGIVAMLGFMAGA